MNATDETLELYRSRWRRFRRELRLENVEDTEFGNAGLGKRVQERGVRLLILPSDPEASVTEFDEAFWKWWKQDWQEPVHKSAMGWYHDSCPTAQAAVRYACTSKGTYWEKYLALHHSGALEMELGRDAKLRHSEKCFVKLICIVGRIWFAFELYRQTVERFSLKGPWEVSLALQDVSDALLCNFGEGWQEPGQGFDDPFYLKEPNVLHKFEIQEWGDAEFCRELAFHIGGRLADAWQFEGRRFLARRGNLAGQFDIRQYPR